MGGLDFGEELGAARGSGDRKGMRRRYKGQRGVGRRKRGGGYAGVRVGEAEKPGPYSEGGATGSGGDGWSLVSYGRWQRREHNGIVGERGHQGVRASTMDDAEGEDPFERLERDLVQGEAAAVGEEVGRAELEEMGNEDEWSRLREADGSAAMCEKGLGDMGGEEETAVGPWLPEMHNHGWGVDDWYDEGAQDGWSKDGKDCGQDLEESDSGELLEGASWGGEEEWSGEEERRRHDNKRNPGTCGRTGH